MGRGTVDAKNVVLTNRRGTRRSSRALWWTRPKSPERWLPDAWCSRLDATSKQDEHTANASNDRTATDQGRAHGRPGRDTPTRSVLWLPIPRCYRVAVTRADARGPTSASGRKLRLTRHNGIRYGSGPEHTVCSRERTPNAKDAARFAGCRAYRFTDNSVSPSMITWTTATTAFGVRSA